MVPVTDTVVLHLTDMGGRIVTAPVGRGDDLLVVILFSCRIPAGHATSCWSGGEPDHLVVFEDLAKIRPIRDAQHLFPPSLG